MVVDGKAIATDILQSVAVGVSKLARAPRLSAITCAPNFETRKYLEMKKRQSASVGVNLNVVELPFDTITEDFIACVDKVAKDSDGVVVQLPLPSQVDRDRVLASVPDEKDPDGFNYETTGSICVPPVVGAIDEISILYQISWKDKHVVVLGQGKLVGLPATHYARQAGAEVTVLSKDTYDESLLANADIIISGIGQPHFIKSTMVKEGVIIFDAGTSEDGGVLAGDVDPEVASKASLLTPVPGGIGPITIAYLLRNLVQLAR